ncbi:hypothetical protein SEVIR_3G279000v4 [Setaria viridis]|uniref:Uncharacterized protein n=2 Tax=Setaria TaxID=4554 RepID=A0A368QJD5_SETIT|nr:hypothetical protein SETIT_3G272200v2 [Setaria italica]TKW27772.1 hypothetical protein SEVIR_3G279000v2 [Setaria viridis]
MPMLPKTRTSRSYALKLVDLALQFCQNKTEHAVPIDMGRKAISDDIFGWLLQKTVELDKFLSLKSSTISKIASFFIYYLIKHLAIYSCCCLAVEVHSSSVELCSGVFFSYNYLWMEANHVVNLSDTRIQNSFLIQGL